MMATGGGSPDRHGIGIQENRQGVTDGVPACGRAVVTQNLKAGDRYPGR